MIVHDSQGIGWPTDAAGAAWVPDAEYMLLNERFQSVRIGQHVGERRAIAHRGAQQPESQGLRRVQGAGRRRVCRTFERPCTIVVNAVSGMTSQNQNFLILKTQ